ncbi:ABC transporter permease [Rhodococcus sp. X156]|uniref:ABC transporter permease n=1 Tax=Rhodococcus sp. X156 TaxID=2499145 RepID=UPI000FDA3DF5|nr:ABC transporter permease [Rhodococcus sp. X156]
MVTTADRTRPALQRWGRGRTAEAHHVLRRLGISDTAALAALAVVFVVALLAPLLAPHSTSVPAGEAFLAPGGGHLLGTDEVGRDILSRVLEGIRSSWLSALLVIASGVVVGGLVGVVAGAVGGWVDSLLMRLTDAFLALPGPLLAICVVAALGPSLTHTLLAVMIVWWPFYARIVRGEVRAQAARPHVEAARLSGVGPVRIALKHLLPGALVSTLVAASLDMGNLIITLAALSFLGLGAPAPAPELGGMAARGMSNLLEHWWVPVMPGVAVLLLALVANLAGDALRNLLADR